MHILSFIRAVISRWDVGFSSPTISILLGYVDIVLNTAYISLGSSQSSAGSVASAKQGGPQKLLTRDAPTGASILRLSR